MQNEESNFEGKYKYKAQANLVKKKKDVQAPQRSLRLEPSLRTIT